MHHSGLLDCVMNSCNGAYCFSLSSTAPTSIEFFFILYCNTFIFSFSHSLSSCALLLHFVSLLYSFSYSSIYHLLCSRLATRSDVSQNGNGLEKDGSHCCRLLTVNFDSKLRELLREVKYFLTLDVEVSRLHLHLHPCEGGRIPFIF